MGQITHLDKGNSLRPRARLLISSQCQSQVSTDPIALCCTSSFFFCFLGPHPQRMEVPKLEVKSELQLPATASATATPVPSQSSTSIHHNSWQHQIPDSPNEARNQIHLMVPSQIHFHCAMMGTPTVLLFDA